MTRTRCLLGLAVLSVLLVSAGCIDTNGYAEYTVTQSDSPENASIGTIGDTVTFYTSQPVCEVSVDGPSRPDVAVVSFNGESSVGYDLSHDAAGSYTSNVTYCDWSSVTVRFTVDYGNSVDTEDGG